MDVENRFSVQSADVENTTTTTMETEQVGFVENNMSESSGMLASVDEVATDIYTGYSELSSFLSRPVKIASVTVPLNQTMNVVSYNPWYLFLNNVAIKKKLDYYAYIQGNLHVKAVINSTPFVYGEYALSYRPMTNFGSQHNIIDTTDAVERVALTQRPTVYLESHKNKGGELMLPFLWHKNWLELKAADCTSMGTLDLYPMAAFQSANGLALTPPTITLYAWMTEVKLAGNTSRLAVQSRDEYGKGPVSGVASAVAGISQRLEDVPVIGKFARATTLGATAIGSIARLFGFTNVPVIDNVAPVKNTPFHGLASSEISVPLEKLTLDPKNELSVDPSTCGAPAADELAISTFAKREGWLAETTWEQTDAVSTELISANVNPNHSRTQGIGDSLRFLDLPMGLAARLFSNWRGDIVYRIKIVKSQYHQGRLLFTYDPTGTALLSSSPETVVNTEIVDISTTDEVVVRIPYMAPQSFLRVENDVSRGITWKGASVAAYNSDYHNGIFRISVLNPLTGPDTTSSVKILVFAHAENFELANPSDVAFKSSLFAVQSSDDAQSTVVSFTLGQSTPSPDNLYSVNFGEDIRSLRTVMRRSNYLDTATAYSTYTAATYAQAAFRSDFTYNIYPPAYGFDPNGRENSTSIISTGTKAANYTVDPPSTWVTACFVGVRGSYNYSVDCPGDATELSALRWNEPIVGLSVQYHYNAQYVMRDDRGTVGAAGMSLTNTDTQRGLQFSVPFMNKYKFIDSSPASRVFGKDADDSENNNFRIRSINIYQPTSFSNYYKGVTVARFGAIGVDYSPIFFLSVPWRWKYDLGVS